MTAAGLPDALGSEDRTNALMRSYLTAGIVFGVIDDL